MDCWLVRFDVRVCPRELEDWGWLLRRTGKLCVEPLRGESAAVVVFLFFVFYILPVRLHSYSLWMDGGCGVGYLMWMETKINDKKLTR